MAFPAQRPRRLRRTPAIRRLVAETRLSIDALIYPLFVHTLDEPTPIPSMPEQFRWPLSCVATQVGRAHELGIPAVILFGIPATKDAIGSGASARDGVVQDAIRRIKDAAPEIVVFADTCLDEYTDHGHCGILKGNEVDNDATLEVLAEVAVSQAEAGADFVAPSDMMDGRVGRIRASLDASGFDATGIMAYSAKYASAFYGPFREAAGSTPQFGDRRGYQMDPPNAREAIREGRLDVEEGADILMVKPALAYLDIIRAFRDEFHLPIGAYNVSGEYAMVKAAGANGWIAEQQAMLEILTAIVRAGADIVLTYHALEVAAIVAAQ
jgi:porphobilinogen synthase